ncbi:MAG TPA: hypothetical protein VNA12_08095 [Mycobacteriales bacterium]|nr:hypothetical protein [Mycobacteriales bacterium]
MPVAPTSLAHPLTDPGGLGVPPYSIALTAVVVIAAVAMLAPIGPAGSTGRGSDGFDDVDRPLWRLQLLTRLLVVVALVGCVYAGRLGNPDGLSNIAPPLVVGVAWPALVVAALCLPRLWSWLDPWDATARAIEPLAGVGRSGVERADDADPAADAAAESGELPPDVAEAAPDVGSVWAGVPAAFAVAHYVVVRPLSTQPRTIGFHLAVYSIVAVALGVAAGRRTLARSEVFGLTARWAGELRDGFAARWRVPRGAEVVLGVLGGGMLFDLARRSGAYLEVLDRLGVSAPDALSERAQLLSLIGTCAITAGVLHLGERAAVSRGAAGLAAVAALPVVLVLLVVTKLRRLLVSLQLLPTVASDPLGRGWDLFGTRASGVDPNPFGTSAQRWTAITMVTLAGVAGAVAVRRRTADRTARDRVCYALFLLVAAAVLGLATAL